MSVRAAAFAATVLALIAAFAVPAGLQAHHGWGSYDAANPVTLSGKVVSSTYDFPHASLILAAGGRNWEVVLAPPSRMQARGADAAMIAPGNDLTAYGYKSTVHDGELRAEWIERDGKRVQLR